MEVLRVILEGNRMSGKTTFLKCMRDAMKDKYRFSTIRSNNKSEVVIAVSRLELSIANDEVFKGLTKENIRDEDGPDLGPLFS